MYNRYPMVHPYMHVPRYPKRPSSPSPAETEEQRCKQKQPRLEDLRAEEFSDPPEGETVQIKLGLETSKLGLGENKPDSVVRCGQFMWECHGDVLAERCSFFGACLGKGFMESTTRQITLDDDEPRAVQAMLRYLYTLDCAQIYRASDPLFSDVERDLDVFVVADKYGLDDLRDYMAAQLKLFYETDQRPPGDPKEWSAKNQEGFGMVLRKVHAMEMEAVGEIRRAIAGFVMRRERMMNRWGVVEEVMREGTWLGNEMLSAALAQNKMLREKVEILEQEVEDLREEMEVAEAEREEMEGEVEHLQGIVNAEDMVDWVDYAELYYGGYPYGGWEYDYEEHHVQMAEKEMEAIETVEDVLSGVSFVLGPDGPMDPSDVEEGWLG